MALVSPRLLIDRLSPRAGTAVAAALLLLVALADAATSYEIRLAILYLLPVGIASWTASAVTGSAVAMLATLIWLLSFASGHFYSHPAYYGLEAAEMLGGLAAFAWVTSRLARALRQADERLPGAVAAPRRLEGLRNAPQACERLFVDDAFHFLISHALHAYKGRVNFHLAELRIGVQGQQKRQRR